MVIEIGVEHLGAGGSELIQATDLCPLPAALQYSALQGFRLSAVRRMVRPSAVRRALIPAVRWLLWYTPHRHGHIYVIFMLMYVPIQHVPPCVFPL
jgi:hypothetical protein